jgi:Carbohydrate-selective porin, OprB family/S-layer homology domain
MKGKRLVGWRSLGIVAGLGFLGLGIRGAIAIALPEDESERALFSSPAQLELQAQNEEPLTPFPPASQFRDVQPTDWAFDALQSLQQRYDCLAGYPDTTYRGNRPLTRDEFAAGLNACLTEIEKFLQKGDLVSEDDLETLRRLQQDFGAELATLKGRADDLEARTAELEDHSFSTTTQLSGIAIVGLQGRTDNTADLNPRDGLQDTEDLGTNANVLTLPLLFLTTNFSPQSYLVTGLLAGIGSSTLAFSNVVGNDGLLAYEFPTQGLIVSDLHFHWLLADNFAVMVGTEGVNMITAFRGPNRFESAAAGPLSYFAQRNPILNIGGYTAAGLAFDWQIARQVSLQAIYQSLNLGVFGLPPRGFFDGNTTAAVQLLLTPADPLDLSLYYVNNYSFNGCFFGFVGDDCLTATAQPLQTHAIGATLNWQISPNITFGVWGGYTNSSIPGQSGNVQTTNYMAYFNFPDLFQEGNLGGIYIGQPPKIVSSDLPVGSNIPASLGRSGDSGGQPGTTLQLEAFYRMRLTDNISLTPGIIQIFQPRHTPDSDPITILVLRTSFTF